MHTDRTTRVRSHTLWATGFLLAGILSAGSAEAQPRTQPTAQPAGAAPTFNVPPPAIKPLPAEPVKVDPVVTVTPYCPFRINVTVNLSNLHSLVDNYGVTCWVGPANGVIQGTYYSVLDDNLASGEGGFSRSTGGRRAINETNSLCVEPTGSSLPTNKSSVVYCYLLLGTTEKITEAINLEQVDFLLGTVKQDLYAHTPTPSDQFHRVVNLRPQ